MMSRWTGLGLGVGLFTIVWIGCGGSEEGSGSSSGGTADSGPETSAPDTGATDSGGGGLLDVPFDGFIDAPKVPITFGTCPAFTPCGGDETGSWKVTGGCLSDEILADVKAQCAGFTTSNETIEAKGTLDADGTNVIRRTQVTLKAKASIPKSCSPIADCAVIALGAQTQLGFDKATCVDGDGGAVCDCDVEDTIVENSVGTYTKNGNTITTDAGDTFDYCVQGGKLSYKQTNGGADGGAAYPLVLELGK